MTTWTIKWLKSVDFSEFYALRIANIISKVYVWYNRILYVLCLKAISNHENKHLKGINVSYVKWRNLSEQWLIIQEIHHAHRKKIINHIPKTRLVKLKTIKSLSCFFCVKEPSWHDASNQMHTQNLFTARLQIRDHITNSLIFQNLAPTFDGWKLELKQEICMVIH